MAKQEILFLGVNTQELAELLGITRQSVRNKIHGKTEFTLIEVDKIQRKYGFTYNEIKEEHIRLKEKTK